MWYCCVERTAVPRSKEKWADLMLNWREWCTCVDDEEFVEWMDWPARSLERKPFLDCLDSDA